MINLELIKRETVCLECNCKGMVVGYSFGDGSLHKKTRFLNGYRHASDMIMIVCRSCGFVNKIFATNPGRLE